MWANNRFCLGQYGDLSPPERNCNGPCGDRSDPGAYAWLVCCITSLSMEYLVIDFDTVFQNDDRALETFSALLALCAGNSPITSEFPHKGQWRRALMFSLICPWINGWINNREAGDLRHHRAHNGVTVMNVLFACHNCAPLWECGHRHSRAICKHCELYLGDLIGSKKLVLIGVSVCWWDLNHILLISLTTLCILCVWRIPEDYNGVILSLDIWERDCTVWFA